MMNENSIIGLAGWLGVAVMLFFWIATIALAIWGLSGRFPSERYNVEQEAREILRQRFARGEISLEEYRKGDRHA